MNATTPNVMVDWLINAAIREAWEMIRAGRPTSDAADRLRVAETRCRRMLGEAS